MRLVAAPFLFVLLFLTSCVIPIANNAKKARYLAELEPPAQYNHPYDGLVEERVLPVADVRVVCDSLGASHSSADASAPGGTAACAWVNDDTCFIILPDDELAPVDTYRRHETAHCNGWPADPLPSPPDTLEEIDTVKDTTN